MRNNNGDKKLVIKCDGAGDIVLMPRQGTGDMSDFVVLEIRLLETPLGAGNKIDVNTAKISNSLIEFAFNNTKSIDVFIDYFKILKDGLISLKESGKENE